MKEIKWRIERGDLEGATHLEVVVRYDLGGANYYSGGTSPRGYYLSVRPITVSGNMVSYNLFSGRRKFLLEATRFSQKQLNFAVQLAKSYEEELINAIVAENKAA